MALGKTPFNAADQVLLCGAHPKVNTEADAPSETDALLPQKHCKWPDPLGPARELSKQISWQLMASVFVTNHLVKGIVAGGGDEGLIGKPMEFILAGHHIHAGRLQALISVGATAPWIMKPLLGFMSDTMPIMGYKKRSYLVLVATLGLIAVFMLGSGIAATPTVIVGCFFFASLQVAGCTLLVDAKQSQVAKEMAGVGPELVSFRETCANSGMIISAMLTGSVIHYWGPRAPYFVALPFCCCIFAIPIFNWLQEERLLPEERLMNFESVKKNPYLFGLGVLLLPLLLMLACGSLANFPERTLVVLALFASGVVVGGYMTFIRPEISGPIVFFFIMRCLNLHIQGALFYFFTDPIANFPEGPHFSPMFYVTGVTSIAIFGRMLGFITARQLFGTWSYQRALSLTIPLVACTQLSLVPLLLRWNLLVGIPDRAYVLMWTFTDMLLRGWRHFPFSVALLQATPQGLEASSMALNSGALNMAMTLSIFFGSFALDLCGVRPSGDSQESSAFSGLWKVQAASALLPLLSVPLIPLFMPSRSHMQTLIDENPTSATHRAPIEACFVV